MKHTNLMVVALAATAQMALAIEPKPATDVAVQQGAYEATWESLSQWECPEWFKDAKFGIWAHWGPQCQAEDGDWYARFMYYQGSGQYNWHVSHFGNPKDYGLKELIRDWKAEQWNPEELVALYKSVGARYFFTLGQHHDNFDLWNSPYQEWNSVNIGPKRDIVGEWAAACEKYDLPLGVSMHGSHTWTWLEPAQAYDGNLTKADGVGQWWEGFDPQELYAQRHAHSTGWDKSGTIHSQWDWINGASLPDAAYKMKFQNRVLQCINDYKPAMLYFDDTVLPFYGCDDQIGLNILQHYYNKNIVADGSAPVVVMGKILKEQHKRAMLWDVERGVPDNIQPQYWQTCTCIGSWHYSQDTYNKGSYKSAQQVISMLIDIVSKNGNLLLNIPVRGNGSIDEKERAVLAGIKEWMDQNSSSIYGTRPWKTFGEGPLAEKVNPMTAQGFNENINYSARDVRYVQRNDTVFATIMRWPSDATFTFKMLGLSSRYYSGKVKSVSLLGHGEVAFQQQLDGLQVSLPATPVNKIAPVFVIAFDSEVGAQLPLATLVELYAQRIDQLRPMAGNGTGKLIAARLDAFVQLVADAKSQLNAAADVQQSVAEALNAAYNDLLDKGYVAGGQPEPNELSDLTVEKLVQASNFSRKTSTTTRFAEPKNWTVENFKIPNGGDGTKLGLDKYPGYDCLMLGIWNDRQNNQSGSLADARIYRTVRLKAGRYYFGAAYNTNYSMNSDAYLFVANAPLSTAEIPTQSIAFYAINSSPNKDAQTFYGLYFTLDREQDVVLGFQANLSDGSDTQEFRAKAVKLLYYGDRQSADITRDILHEDSEFARADEEVTTRFAAPKYWTVDNFRIPNGGDGTKQGLDNYPGYDCLMLGVWNDRQSNESGSLANARISQTAHLTAGEYFFGATYEANYQLSEAYIFAADAPLATTEIKSKAIANASIATAGNDNATFHGITFTLDEEKDVVLGFQADLSKGSATQEFRVSAVRLLSYAANVPAHDTGISARKPLANDAAAQYFDLTGARLPQSPERGIYVVRKGNKGTVVRN